MIRARAAAMEVAPGGPRLPLAVRVRTVCGSGSHRGPPGTRRRPDALENRRPGRDEPWLPQDTLEPPIAREDRYAI